MKGRGLFRREIPSVLAGVDRIIHAGDVGGGEVLEALSRIAPVDAVFGNVDDPRDPMLAREIANGKVDVKPIWLASAPAPCSSERDLEAARSGT